MARTIAKLLQEMLKIVQYEKHMPKNISELRREEIESKIKKIEEAINDCTFTGINIIKDTFDLGWYSSGVNENDAKRLYALGEKFQKNCECWIRK